MPEPGSTRRGRAHNAEESKEAILDAAEQVFAEHGFDGARIDAIAAAAGYNKSLIFQYFGDKLGLYAEVLRRVDRATAELQGRVLEGLFEDGQLLDAARLRRVLRTYGNAYFDYLVQHPRLTRILLWELAEGWQTFARVVTERDYEDVEHFRPVLEQLQATGLLRSNFDPMLQVILIEFFYPCYLACIPLFKIMLPGAEVSSPEAQARAREYMADFMIRGLLKDPAEGEPDDEPAGNSAPVPGPANTP